LFIGFTGLSKAKIEAQQTISILESQLRFLDKAECFHVDDKNILYDCTTTDSLRTIAEKELAYLQNLPTKENSIEVIINQL